MTRIKWLSIVRITGLFLVLIYHFFKDILPGGFIGVDVFFTISGFLVTMSMIGEFQNNGSFRFFAFCKRRFLRLYPPLLLSILFTLPFAMMLSPDFTANIKRQLAAALGFVTNYFEILNGGSYEAQLLPHLYVHTWFLAVEVHLYLLWGIFCAFIALLPGRMYQKSAGKSVILLKVFLFIFSAAGAALSYLWMQTKYSGAADNLSAVYFDTGGRAFPFLIGAAAAVLFANQTNNKGKIRIPSKAVCILSAFVMIVLIGGLFVMARVLHFNAGETYRYGFAVAAIITVIIIRLVLVLHKAESGSNEPGLLTGLADLSYNIYLFHWPLYIVYCNILRDNLLASGVTIAVSAALSSFVFFCMEPLFHGRCPLSIDSPPVLRRLFYATAILLVMGAATLNGFALARAPEITSLEAEMNTGYLYQDVDEIYSLRHLAEAINDEPLAQTTTGQLPMAYRNFSINYVSGRYTEYAAEMFPMLLVSGSEWILPGVTIIGDSVTLGAYKKLSESFPNCHIDAQGSRQMEQGYMLLLAMQENNTLRENVVVSLGTNQNSNSFEMIDKIINAIRPGHRLIFVTPYIAGMDENWITYKIMEYIKTLPAIYPFVTVADWALAIGRRKELLGSDKIHVGGNATAINMYVDCIANAILAANAKPPK